MKSDLLLCLDTTGETYSLALSSGRKILSECSGGQPRQHLVQIFPAVQMLCQQSGVTLSQLTGVAVTGGFSVLFPAAIVCVLASAVVTISMKR